MKRSIPKTTLTLLLLGGLVLSGCNLPFPSGNPNDPLSQASPTHPAPVATPVDTPAPLAPPETAVPQESAPFAPLTMSAGDCAYGGEFKTIEALDRSTVRFTLCKPDVAFLSKIAFPSFGILPAEFLEQTGGGGKDSPLLLKPVGTGPYRLEAWETGQALRLTAFDGYWGDQKAQIPEIVFRWNLDDSQRLLELQTGTVQGIDSPNPQDFAAIQADANLAIAARPPLSIVYLGMNNTYPPMDNQLVRLAISLAIDRQAIVEKFFSPGFELASYFTPCAIPNGCVGEPWYGYDPKMARDVLAEAGYPDGFQTQISYRNLVRGYLPQPAQVAKEIQSELKKNLNVSAQLAPIDSPEFLQAADDGLLPGLFLLGWGADYPDVSDFLDTHFGSQASMLFGKPFSDVLENLSQGSSVFADAARQPYYVAANNAIREHVPMIPLAYGGWIDPNTLAAAFQRSVQGAYASPFGLERFADFSLPGRDSLVWMQANEPLSLYCADETDVDSLRACAQVIETLYRFKSGTAQVEPGLAKGCEPSADLTVWTCSLREGVKFHDGSTLDANDVVASFLVQWDAAHPLHKGRAGEFAYFKGFWGAFLNAAAP